MIIVKYIFDHNIYANLIPQFNEGYIYTIKDEVGTYTTRTIESDVLPTKIQFGNLDGSSSLLEVLEIDTKNVTNMSHMFYGCNNLTSLDLRSFNTKSVTTMNGMFYYCNKLTSLDLSNFDTTKVTTMSSMFLNCNKLVSLDVSGFDTSNVTTMGAMFQNCNALTFLDVSNFDTSNVTTMGSMFNGCNTLTYLDVSNFNTSSVTVMSYMLQNCNNLTSLDLSNFDTKNVTNMNGMFNNCNTLTSLDVSNFDTSNVTDMVDMFNNCNRLTDIGMVYCSKDTVEKIGNLITASNVNIWIDMEIEKPKDTDKVTYKQYAEDYEILLTSPLLEGDTIEEIGGDLYHVHRFKQVIFDGSEDETLLKWSKQPPTNYSVIIVGERQENFLDIKMIDGYQTTDNMMVEGYQATTMGKEHEGFQFYNNLHISISNSKLLDVTNCVWSFREYLKQNPLKVIYELAEPTYEKIGTQDELKFANEKIKPITSVPLTDTELNYTDDSIRLTKESRYVGNEAKLNEKFSNVELSGRTMVNVCDQKDSIPLTRSYTVETGNHIALEGEYDGKAKPYVYGNTLVNLMNFDKLTFNGGCSVSQGVWTFQETEGNWSVISMSSDMFKPNTTYTLIFNLLEDTTGQGFYINNRDEDHTIFNDFDWKWVGDIGVHKFVVTTKSDLLNRDISMRTSGVEGSRGGYVKLIPIILEGDWTDKPIPQYFEGLQSSFEDGRVPMNIVTDTEFEITYTGSDFQIVANYLHLNEELKQNTDYTIVIKEKDTNTITGLRLSYEEKSSKTEKYVIDGNILPLVTKFNTKDLDINCLRPYLNTNEEYIGKTVYFNVFLLEGDYSNYDFSDYDSANGGKYKVEYKVTGKNKFDGWEQGHINDLGELYDDPNSVRSNYIKVIPNTQYTFSNNGIKRATHISYYDERKQFIFTSDRGHPPSTFVMPSNCMYIRLSGGNNDRDKFQLEEGEVATSYEPYKEYTKTLYLNSPLLEGDSIEVRGNDIYHIHRYGKVVLDGSELEYGIHEVSNDMSNVNLWYAILPESIGGKMGTVSICDKLLWGVVDTTPNEDYEHHRLSNSTPYANRLYIWLNKNKCSTVEECKQYLQQNPITVVYELVSPTYEVISTNDNLYIDSYVNGHLDFNSVVPVDKVKFMYETTQLKYLKPSTEYIIQFNADNVGRLNIINLGGKTLSINNDIVKGVNKFTITTESTLNNNILTMVGIGANISNIVVTEAVDEEFGYFSGLQSSFEDGYDEESGKYKVEYKVTGKNKFDESDFRDVSVWDTRFKGYGIYYTRIKVNPNSKYILSMTGSGTIRISNPSTITTDQDVWGKNIDYIQDNKLTSNYHQFTSGYITLAINKSLYENLSTITSLQIEEGTVATTYEPYYEYTKTLYLNSPLLEGDRIIAKNDGLYHEHRYNSVVLDGDKDKGTYSINRVEQDKLTTPFYVKLRNIPKPKKENKLRSVICDKYASDKSTWYVNCDFNNIYQWSDDSADFVGTISGYTFNNTDLVNYLSNNPITVVYELASPTYEKISDDILLAKVASTGTLEVQSAVPCSEIALTNAKKELKYLYTNKDYTVQFVAHGQGEVIINLGGTNKTVNVVDGLNTFQIKTPSTLLHNNLYLNGTDIYVEDIVVTDSVQENIGYFDGLQSSYEDKEIEFVVTDENNKVVNSKKYTLSSPLLKDDTIECVDGKLYHVHRYGNVVFNSSDGWAYNSTMSANSEFYAFYKSDSSLNRKTQGYVYCDQLPSLLYSESVASNIIIKECIRTDSSSALYLFISSSAEELNEYLAENPVTVVYELATPTYELIDEIGYIDSYANGHIILNDTVIPIQEFKTLAFEEELAYLYANTSYTIQFESDRESHVKFYLGGTEYSTNIIKGLNRVTITTPSTLVDNILRLNGTDVKISEVVVVNSDKDFEYFEGLQSVSNDIMIHNNNIYKTTQDTYYQIHGSSVQVKRSEPNNFLYYTEGWDSGLSYIIDSTPFIKGKKYITSWEKPYDADYMALAHGTEFISIWDSNFKHKKGKVSIKEITFGVYEFIMPDYFDKTDILQVHFKNSQINRINGATNIMIYEEEKPLSYIEPKYSIQNLTLSEPLRAVGNVKDRYVLKDGKWYIERNCAEVVLDGSENWGIINKYDTTTIFAMVFNIGKANTPVICDRINNTFDTFANIPDQERIKINSNNYLVIMLKNDKLSTKDVSGFKQWLSKNPTKVVYRLATPTYELIDYNPFEVSSDKTYITTNSVIPPRLTVKNTGFNCNVTPNTTYTIASNKGIHHITTASELDDTLRFYGTGKLNGLRVLDGIVEDYAIPSVFKGLQNAFGQEYFGNIANKKLYGSAVRYEKGDIVTNNVTNRVCYIINNPKPDTVYTIISRTQGLISTNSCYLGNEKSTELTQLSVDIFENGIYTVKTNADASKALAVNMKYDNERDINIDEIECYVVEGDWSDMTEKDFTDNFGKYKVNFKMRGKNLFDASQVIANKYQSGADDRYAIVDNEEYSLYYLQVISNMIITSNIALSGVWYSNELPIMEQESDTMFTVPFGCNIFALRIPKNVNINNLQIEVGDEATTYRQYQEYNVTFYIEQPLRSFKDFEDTFMWRENTLFVKRRCGELVLNGSEDWLAYSTNNEANNIAFKLENYLETTYTDDEVYCVSDLFTATPAKNIHNDIEGISFVNKDIIIKVSRAKLLTQDVDGFKQYLQNHNTTVVYNTGNIVYEEIGLIDKLLPLYDESTLSYNTIVPVKTTLSYSTKTPSIVGANDNIATLQSINDEQDMQTLELQYKMCLLEMLLEDEEGL